ncbi:MAG: enolase C-terminal domain-like protein, partial [Burkholderiales bacterium]
VAITVDANGAYEAKTAIRVINRMEPYDIALFEQPVGRHDREGLAVVTRATNVAIEADESAGSMFEIRDLVRRRAVDSICLRMPRLGGVQAALFAARFCLEEGVKFRFGMCFMPSLGQAAIAHVAATLPEVFIAHEIPEAHAYGEDPFDGTVVKDGMITVDSSAPGLGLSPLPDRNDFTVLATAA